MDLKENDYIYIVEKIGDEVYINEGYVISYTETSLKFKPKQPPNEIGIKLLNKEYYPKQKNIYITLEHYMAKLVYLAKKLRGKYKCDVMCRNSIANYTGWYSVNQVNQEIENSKTQFPEMWF
jgi:hypothetical protein